MNEVFSPTTLAEMVRVLIRKYFLYTIDDLNQWEESPEEFVSDESGDSWKYSLRVSRKWWPNIPTKITPRYVVLALKFLLNNVQRIEYYV